MRGGESHVTSRYLFPHLRDVRCFVYMAAALARGEGGFDANFVEPLADRLTCPICHLALQEPQLTRCGHQFCFECLRPLIRDATVLCPVCRKDLKETEIFPNNMVKREILSLKIKCDKQEDGCEWIGELRQQDEHNQTCGYETVPCDNDCNEMVMRKDKNHHKKSLCPRRIVRCSYCDVKLEYQEASVHFETCVKYPVGCEYGCGMQIPRGDMDIHTSREGKCSKSPLQCDFTDAGCTFRGNRRQLGDHLEQSTVRHLSLVMKSLHTTTEKLAASDKRHEELAKKLADTEAVLFASDTRQEELAKKLADTEGVLAMRALEVENMKKFLMLESKSSQALEILMKDGLEKSLESSRFLRSVLADKRECSIEASGTFFFMWKMKIRSRDSYSSQFYTGQPGWHLKVECTPVIEKKQVIDLRPTHMSVIVYRLKGHHDNRLGVSLMTLRLTLVNRQSTKNIVHKSAYGLPIGILKVLGHHCVEIDGIMMKYQLSYDETESQRFVENDEILFKLQFEPNTLGKCW